MRHIPAVATVVLFTACSIPGIAPEGRDARVTHQEIPASPSEVHQRALQFFARNGYAVASSSAAQHIVAEKPAADGRINVLEVRVSGIETATRLELHGWTETSTPLGRRKAAQYDPAVGTDLYNLSRYLSCPAAQRPRCP